MEDCTSPQNKGNNEKVTTNKSSMQPVI